MAFYASIIVGASLYHFSGGILNGVIGISQGAPLAISEDELKIEFFYFVSNKPGRSG